MPWTKLQADALTRRWYPASEKDARMLTYREALKEAQAQALQTDPDVFIMGEGVDDPGGIFGTTKDLATIECLIFLFPKMVLPG